jgi:hypothetical protein
LELPAVTELLAVPELTVPVPVLPEPLEVPVLEGTFEPHPAVITLIRATIVRTDSGRSVLLMVLLGLWNRVGHGARESAGSLLVSVAGHAAIERSAALPARMQFSICRRYAPARSQ